MLARSRSADFRLQIEAPPVPAVISVFPDKVEAASDAVINLALANMFSSASHFFVRTKNGTFVSNVSVVSVHDNVYLLQFSMPDSRIPGKPLIFDFQNALEIASASHSTISAGFFLYVLAPSNTQIFISPRFTNLLTTEAPLATFVLTNFGGMPGADAVSAVLSVDSVLIALAVTSYKSDGSFGTVSVQFPNNIHAAKPAEVTIFPKSSGSESGAMFSFTYVFPAPVVGPSLACTNGKSAGFVVLTAALPSGIDSQNFKISVNGAAAQIVFTSLLFNSSHMIIDNITTSSYTFQKQQIFGLGGNFSKCNIFVSWLPVPVDVFLPPVLSFDFFVSPDGMGGISWLSSSCDAAQSLQSVKCNFSFQSFLCLLVSKAFNLSIISRDRFSNQLSVSKSRFEVALIDGREMF
jgi:hypothetical protein